MVIGPQCFDFTQRGIRSTSSSGSDDPGEPGNMGVGKSLGGKWICHPCGEFQMPHTRCFALSPNCPDPCLRPIFHWAWCMGRDALEPGVSSPAEDVSAQTWVVESDDLLEEAPLRDVKIQFWKHYKSKHPVEASPSDQLLSQLLHVTQGGDPQDSDTRWANQQEAGTVELWGSWLTYGVHTAWIS